MKNFKISKFWEINDGNGLAGIVGYISKDLTSSKFVQILILPDYRKKGIARLAVEEMVEIDDIDVLCATIKDTNVASIKLFENMGFTKVDPKGLKLPKGYSRYVKDYKEETKNIILR